MAKAKDDDVDPALKRWVTAQMPEKETAPPEKADTSYTIYVSKSEAEKIAKIQKQFGTTRQETMRQLLQAGLKQFGRLTGWWKDE
jgi:hypothetical protein